MGGDITHAKKLRGAANSARLTLDGVKSKLQHAKEDKVTQLQNDLNVAESEFDQAVMLARNAMKTVLESVQSSFLL